MSNLIQIFENGEKEFKEHIDWLFNDTNNREHFRFRIKTGKFLLHHTIKLLEGIVEDMEGRKKTMKETHICRFNDGKCDCECYLSALTDSLAPIKELLVKLKEKI